MTMAYDGAIREGKKSGDSNVKEIDLRTDGGQAIERAFLSSFVLEMTRDLLQTFMRQCTCLPFRSHCLRTDYSWGRSILNDG